jgi:Histidine kinase-, DNA gyrase B-, and HSP90-like ATPase
MSTSKETFKAFQQDDVLSGADAASNVVIKPEEEYAYGFIIEVLTSGLYPDVFHVIREYVQNSFDAIIAWRRMIGDSQAGNVQITTDSPSIFVFDDGTGMDRKKVREYRYVGYSNKSIGSSVGFRGIGKLSGISVAEKLILTTSPYGVAERYKLVFDAKTMLEHILELKQQGQNIPLNELIQKYTTLGTEKEDIDQHYTLIELHNIRQKSQLLLDQKELSHYLALNAPVDFDPDFKYRATVDEWLRTYVKDYDTVPVRVNGTRVYKYYLPNAKPPQREFVWSDEDNNGTVPTRYTSSETNDSEEDTNTPKLLAFCWYCEHEERGQFEDRQRRGLVYRVRNFAVGDNQLPRITLWKASPERAYYFFGEIYVCDPEVVPSSERGNFEENSAR